jgi:hypothetical protein
MRGAGGQAMASTRFCWGTAAVLWIAAAGGCGKAPGASFAQDVQPILRQACVPCHEPGGEGLVKSGFGVESYESVMRGTRFGPVIEPGSSVSSTLLRLLEQEADPSLDMPRGQHKLAPDRIEVIRAWIDQGAPNN